MVGWVTWRGLTAPQASQRPQTPRCSRFSGAGPNGRQGVSMTLSSRPRTFSRFAQVATKALVVVLAGLVLTGCPDDKIGRKCDLDTDDAGTTGTTSSATINSQAVECPSRICLLP